jgi:mRNA interferase MazF
MSIWPNRGEIYWVDLDPARGSEIAKKRPALIVSNNAHNKISRRVIVAPITSTINKVFPFEVALIINGKHCKILLDQLRSVDKIRLDNRIYIVPYNILEEVERALKTVFSLQ